MINKTDEGVNHTVRVECVLCNEKLFYYRGPLTRSQQKTITAPMTIGLPGVVNLLFVESIRNNP